MLPDFPEDRNEAGQGVRIEKVKSMKQEPTEQREQPQDEMCELPVLNASSDRICSILEKYKTVAVVGLSRFPHKDSHRVAKYLEMHGYTVIPVNPSDHTVMGKRSYATLKEIPSMVDIVCIFRPPSDVPPIVAEAIAIGAKVVWMQLGITHNDAAEKARSAGIDVVMNKCMKIEHSNLGRT